MPPGVDRNHSLSIFDGTGLPVDIFQIYERQSLTQNYQVIYSKCEISKNTNEFYKSSNFQK